MIKPSDSVGQIDYSDEAAKMIASGKAKLYASPDGPTQALRYDGPCPRCGYPLQQTRQLNLVVFGMRGNAADKKQGYADFLCDCEQQHGDGKSGCGALFSLDWKGDV